MLAQGAGVGHPERVACLSTNVMSNSTENAEMKKRGSDYDYSGYSIGG